MGSEAGSVAPRPPAAMPDAAPVPDTPMPVGDAYRIDGRSYTPIDQNDYDEVGYASSYGPDRDGRTTANGEAFNANWLTGAHRTLPLPSYVEITRIDTGRTILVRINDRGPADPNRLIVLSAGAAQQLGFAEQGIMAVRVRRTNPVEAERLALRSGRPAQIRIDTPETLLTILRERAARLPVPVATAAPASTAVVTDQPTIAPTTITAATPRGSGRFVVQIAAFSDRARAEALAQRLNASVVVNGAIYRVRFGPFTSAAEAEAAVVRAQRAGQPGAVILRDQ